MFILGFAAMHISDLILSREREALFFHFIQFGHNDAIKLNLQGLKYA